MVIYYAITRTRIIPESAAWWGPSVAESVSGNMQDAIDDDVRFCCRYSGYGWAASLTALGCLVGAVGRAVGL
jgi:hypothetical protein